MHDTIEKLIEYFAKLPSIGPRQARRIVYYLAEQNSSTVSEFGRTLEKLPKAVAKCTSCFRNFPKDVAHENSKDITCRICADTSRTRDTLLIVEKDVDFENIEKSKIHSGLYFILGGTVSLTGRTKSGARLRFPELKKTIEARAGDSLSEIILAFATHPEGEETASLTKKEIAPLLEKYNIKLSTLGRGLSTGAELEYADPETIKNAWESRR
jgi:recombination protein RecR